MHHISLVPLSGCHSILQFLSRSAFNSPRVVFLFLFLLPFHYCSSVSSSSIFSRQSSSFASHPIFLGFFAHCASCPLSSICISFFPFPVPLPSIFVPSSFLLSFLSSSLLALHSDVHLKFTFDYVLGVKAEQLRQQNEALFPSSVQLLFVFRFRSIRPSCCLLLCSSRLTEVASTTS